jgi:predicted nucleic acid-binding protein
VKERVIVDTGPLVAALNRNDRYHEWAVAQFREINPPLCTCEAVITETFHLLRCVDGGVRGLLDLLSRGVVTVPFRLEEEVTMLARLLRKYSDVPMALADACVVRLSEMTGDSTVFTIDRQFKIYRRHGRQVIPTILPG